MDEPPKFLLPKPDFSKKPNMAPKSAPNFLTPSGMTLLPRDKQPPPMYGPKGSTIPSKFLAQQKNCQEAKPQERHFCEPCEMEFQSMDDFRRHRAQHEHCPVDGCKYKAHPTVMDKHVTELHASGIFEKIKKISTPEEIAAWREERRKKFPTLANTQMRQLAKEQRQRRGERLEESKSRFGRHEDRKRARNVEKSNEKRPVVSNNSQKERNNKGRDKRPPRKTLKNVEEKQAVAPKATVQTDSNVDIVSCGIRMFEGTSNMKDYKHEKAKKPQTKNVLSGLLGMYGSDEDDNSNTEDEDFSETPTEEKQILDKIEISYKSDKRTVDCKLQEMCKEDQQKSIKGEQFNTSLNVDITDVPDSQNEQLQETPIDPKPIKIQCKVSANMTPNLNLIVATSSFDNSSNSLQQIQNETIKSVEDKFAENSSDEAPEEAPIERTTSVPPAIVKPALSTTNLESGAPTLKRAKLEDPQTTLKQKRKYGLDYRNVRLRRQNTMLEKLLEPDIRHERNVLLQCVRFVCQNNFFGIGSENKSTEKNATV